MRSRFVCQSCGADAPRWEGRCRSCGEWDTLVEEAVGPPAARPRRSARRQRTAALEPLGAGGGAESGLPARLVCGMDEFDRVCGGGMAAGSVLLVAGDPGIGKSTLMLQVAAGLDRAGLATVYVSGEEGAGQVRARAARLELDGARIPVAADTELRAILAALQAAPPSTVIIDSIQTMWLDALESAPGTVAQVRACAQELTRFAKTCGATVILVGHVTKDGQIAGPRVIEHMVDTVLHFEGERSRQFRILRAIKNRCGATDEIGVFEMGSRGLREIANPSALFLDDRNRAVTGAAVFAGMEGTRPMLTEIQALVAQSALGTPRRASVGCDSGRLAMILAVLDARAGLPTGGRDVYLNVAGGLRVQEPAADLAMTAALASSLAGRPPPHCVFFGEVSLSGAVRPVAHAAARFKEAARLGFTRAICPPVPGGAGDQGLEVTVVNHVQDLAAMLDLAPRSLSASQGLAGAGAGGSVMP